MVFVHIMASLEAVQNSVAHDAKNCWEIFQEVIVLFNDVENRRTISLDFQEEFEGFRVWCRSAGAFAEDHASLDYRLRDNAPTRKLIRTILQGLNSSLSQCELDIRGGQLRDAHSTRHSNHSTQACRRRGKSGSFSEKSSKFRI